jgi:hypothetical protein
VERVETWRKKEKDFLHSMRILDLMLPYATQYFKSYQSETELCCIIQTTSEGMSISDSTFPRNY